MRTLTKKLLLTAGFAAGALMMAVPEAHAVDWVIKSPNAHPSYSWELEPHLNLLPYRVGWGRGSYRRSYGALDVGAGFRATVEIADPFFIRGINNTIGISFGADFNNCRYCGFGRDYEIWSPVALQWNFFLTRKWSAFAEFGGIIHSYGFFRSGIWIDPAIFLGTRIHFNDKIALTIRAGTPWVGVGVSFFVGG